MPRICSLFLILASSALAQVTTTTIHGTVSDRSGAVVPSAQVTASNLSTGQSRVSQTGARWPVSIRVFFPSAATESK